MPNASCGIKLFKFCVGFAWDCNRDEAAAAAAAAAAELDEAELGGGEAAPFEPGTGGGSILFSVLIFNGGFIVGSILLTPCCSLLCPFDASICGETWPLFDMPNEPLNGRPDNVNPVKSFFFYKNTIKQVY